MSNLDLIVAGLEIEHEHDGEDVIVTYSTGDYIAVSETILSLQAQSVPRSRSRLLELSSSNPANLVVGQLHSTLKKIPVSVTTGEHVILHYTPKDISDVVQLMNSYEG
tara:strand:- start:182 stop:505 length:324 start_codon:yes stop_codon:yes gene_type:complete